MSSSHDDHPDLPPPSLTEVAAGVFAYVQPDGSWFINNTGFIRGERTVVSLDTCATERRTRDYLGRLEEVTGQVPTVLVSTHHHGDHTNGNCLLPFATIIGQTRCREEMQRAGIQHFEGLVEHVDWGALSVAPPFVTFDHRLEVHIDDLKIELVHLVPAAHTTNDVVAWIPEHRVLFSGDLVLNGSTPFALMGSVAGWLEALDMIEELQPAVIVPGHGEPAGIEAVDASGEYLRWLQRVASDAVAAGLSPLEAAREADPGEFAALLAPERTVGNLHRAMAECRGLQRGSPIDLSAAFADMITLNGGRPLRCMA